MSKGVVTYHFTSKDALLRQVVASLYERAGDRIAARVDAADTVTGALEGYLEANLAFVAEDAAHVRAVMEIAANLHRADGGPAAGGAGADPVTSHLRALIERGQAGGERAAVDAGVLATIIRAAIDTAAARCATDPGFHAAVFTRELVLVVRRGRWRFARLLALDVVLPLVLYSALRAVGASPWVALLAGAAIPVTRLALAAGTRRRPEMAGAYSLSLLVAGTTVGLLTADPRRPCGHAVR